jgi:hypothetical protein
MRLINFVNYIIVDIGSRETQNLRYVIKDLGLEAGSFELGK